MEELFNLGINEDVINGMLEINQDIKEMTGNDIWKKLLLLRNIDCSDKQIINIITSNPLYLSRTSDEIMALFNYLHSMGFDTLNILFDANPYILNLEPFEIMNYVSRQVKNGAVFENIIDEMDANPYLFSEI